MYGFSMSLSKPWKMWHLYEAAEAASQTMFDVKNSNKETNAVQYFC
jgi:hypothetical protein